MDQQKQIRATRLLQDFLREEAVTAREFVARHPDEEQEEVLEAITLLDTLVQHNEIPSPSEARRRRASLAVQRRKRELNLAELRERVSHIRFDNVRQYARDLVGAEFILNRAATMTNSPTPEWQKEASNQRIFDKKASDAATNLLEEIGSLQLPIDPKAVAEYLGILVKELPLSDREGCVFRKDDLVTILLNSDKDNLQRRRFTCAHEVGHSLLHADVGLFEDSAETARDFHTVRERQAHVFASYLLAPKREVLLLMKGTPSIFQGDAIHRKFDISLAAALIRVVTDSNWDCALVASYEGRVQWSFTGEHFPGFVTYKRRLPQLSVAYALEAREASANESDKVEPGQWLSEEIWIHEESRRMNSGWIYSILRPTKAP